MTQTANNYGTVLFELGVEKETVEEMKRIFSLTGELPRVLDCPVVPAQYITVFKIPFASS